MSGQPTLAYMRERTPFGDRLFKARTHAKLSQGQLARAAGVSQGTLGELEWKADSSIAAVRLAMACGVRPEWLAEGEGGMLDANAWPFQLVSLEEIQALDQRELGIVEGAMLAALDRIHPPNAEDLKRFQDAHAPVSSKKAKRKAA
jgi:transcriptional regulator with XRE-family HTH domain